MEKISPKYATVLTVDAITPNNYNPDYEILQVSGWTCVEPAGKYKIGDKVIAYRWGALLPDIDRYKKWPEYYQIFQNNTTGYRIRAYTVKGSLIKDIPIEKLEGITANVGDDLSNILNITKCNPHYHFYYCPPKKCDLPDFIPSTNIELVQNLNIQEYLKLHDLYECFYSKYVYTTELLAGLDISMYLYENKFGICTDTYEILNEKNNIYLDIVKKYNVEEKLKNYKNNIVLSGVIIGPNVYGNPLKLIRNELYITNIYNIETDMNYNFDEIMTEIPKIRLPFVPFKTFFKKDTPELNPNQENYNLNVQKFLMKYSLGGSFLNAYKPCKGLVINKKYSKCICKFKIINKLYQNLSNRRYI